MEIDSIYAGYNAYCSTVWGLGNNRMIGNRQVSSSTWALGSVTHDGPNLLFWDGHVERYIYPKSGNFCDLFPQRMLSVDGSAGMGCP